MQSMSRLLDIVDRSMHGPTCDEKEFDLKYVADGVADVVRKYGIRFDETRIVQCDDDLCDRVWQAGIELFERCGVYNRSTHRRMTFSRREIEEVIKWAPRQATIGEGTDERLIVHRKVGDPRPPVYVGGPIGAPLTEEMFLPVMQSYIQEPIIDAIATGGLITTHGREIRARSPLEVIASWEDCDLTFAALRRAGRPGMNVSAANQSPSALGYLSVISRFGYRPTDRHSIAMIGEMKTDTDLLCKLAHSVRQAGIVLGFYNPIFGGLAGGEEGLSVLITAGMIGLEMVYMATHMSTCPTHPFLFCDTTRQILRSISVATAAIARNSPLLTMPMTSPAGGPGTEVLLYECLAMAATATVCGAPQLLGVRSAVGTVLNHCTGLEARFNAEVGYAMAGVSREAANVIVEKAVALYEPLLSTKPIGKPFEEVYDPVTIQPRKIWLDVYDRVKEQASEWGVAFR